MKIIGNIRQAISENGSISIAQFMSEAMYNIHEGYYINNNPIGKNGDFITAPEISQLFGEMLGVYSADLWIKMGKPANFNLVELGPGQATLMSDLLRATKHIEGFHQACNIHLIEKNKRLIKIQKAKLAKYNLPITWHNSVYALPNDLPIIMLANEFFDCLPINQYIKSGNTWHEQAVSINGTEFCFTQLPISTQKSESLNAEHPNAKDRAIVEICYPAIEIIQHITKLFKNTPGGLLIIDYGYDLNPLNRTAYDSTLQAVMNHKFHPIFSDIGRADLTAHVDFFALRQTAIVNHCFAEESISQKEFLFNLGILFRAQLLKSKSNPSQAKMIESGLRRLIDDDQMGKLFKAMTIYSKDLFT